MVRLFDKVEKWAQQTPEAPAFFERHATEIRTYTCRDIFQQICAARYVYHSLPQQRVGILMENSAAYFVASSALILAGKVSAMLDNQANVTDLIHAVEFSEIDLLVYDEANAELAENICRALPAVERMAFENPSFHPMMEEGADTWTEADTLFYTSGTSKNSKVVVTPSWAIEANIRGLDELRPVQPQEVSLIPVPYYHAYGFSAVHIYYAKQSPVFVSCMGTLRKDIRVGRPMHLALVPSALEFLHKKDAFGDSVKCTLLAGSYLPPELAHAVEARGILVQNEYGSSEIPSGFAINKPGDPVDALSPATTVRFFISSDSEVIVETDCHFTEYYRNPEDTAATLKEGRVYTGDVGFLDEKNRLHLQGRRKNLILMENGDKVFYTDVDEELKALPGIDDAAVIYEDKTLIAVVALEEGAGEDQAARSIADYNATQPIGRVIRKIWVYGPKLPYTNSGKLARSVLEREYPSVKDDL